MTSQRIGGAVVYCARAGGPTLPRERLGYAVAQPVRRGMGEA